MLQAGQLTILRGHRNQALDASLAGFDLFTALWWPLREKNKFAPRKEVSWLIAKSYAARPMPQLDGALMPDLLGRLYHEAAEDKRKQIIDLNDRLLNLSIRQLEPCLDHNLALIQKRYNCLDWAWLLDKLSVWESLSTREQWAELFINAKYKTREVNHD